MGPRASVGAIILVTFVIWMGSRATAIALPLVALAQTGDAWTTGLVLGAQSLPLITVGWWGARLRERITSGRAVAAVMAVKVLGLAIVPAAARLHAVGVPALAACGLIVGATSALDAPGVRSLLADLGDRLGPGSAARALTLQDLAHRCTMFLAPPLGALAVGRGHTMALLWSECAAVAFGALLLTALPRTAHPASAPAADEDLLGPDPAPRPERPAADPAKRRASLLAVVRQHPRMASSIAVHAMVNLTWFAFSLGLAIAGAETNRPGQLIAAGMTGYGVASTAASIAAPLLVNRLPRWPTAVLPALVLGASFIVLAGQLGSLVAITLLAAVGGLTMPLGIGAHNRILATEPAPGAPRRTAFTADQIASGGAGAVGMLVGGAIVGLAGAPATLVGAGVLLVAASGAALALRPQERRSRSTETASAICGPDLS